MKILSLAERLQVLQALHRSVGEMLNNAGGNVEPDDLREAWLRTCRPLLETMATVIRNGEKPL